MAGSGAAFAAPPTPIDRTGLEGLAGGHAASTSPPAPAPAVLLPSGPARLRNCEWLVGGIESMAAEYTGEAAGLRDREVKVGSTGSVSSSLDAASSEGRLRAGMACVQVVR